MERREFLWPFFTFIKKWNILKRECKILSYQSKISADLGDGQWATCQMGIWINDLVGILKLGAKKGTMEQYRWYASNLHYLTMRKKISSKNTFTRPSVYFDFSFRTVAETEQRKITNKRHSPSSKTSLSWLSQEIPRGEQPFTTFIKKVAKW